MTLEEAKDILKKEFAVINLHKSTEPFEFDDSNWFGYEKPSVLEAFRVLSKEGYYITISGHDYDMRKKRLEKEYEKNTKASGSAENLIKEDSGVNPALAESASQFNDALLDEQAKKIEKLAYENERLKDQIVVLDACKKHNDKIDRLQIKRLGKEIAKLNGIIHDKNAILADVAEELRLSKIREKNLTELCQKYIKANEKLKKELADKVVDKIDAQALKSAESALAWKEKVIAEKDEVIDNLRNELKAQKGLVNHISKKYDGAKINLNLRMKECEKLEEALDEAKKQNTAVMVDMTAKCLRAARESINDVFESYAAKYAKSSLDDLKEKAYELFNAKAHNLGLVGNKDGNGIIDQMVGADIAEEGGDQSATIVQCDNGITLSKEEAEIIERCTKNGTELHYSEKDGLTYTNMYGEEMPIRYLRGMFHVFTDEEIKNMKK